MGKVLGIETGVITIRIIFIILILLLSACNQEQSMDGQASDPSPFQHMSSNERIEYNQTEENQETQETEQAGETENQQEKQENGDIDDTEKLEETKEMEGLEGAEEEIGKSIEDPIKGIRIVILAEKSVKPEAIIKEYGGIVEQSYEEMNMAAGYVDESQIEKIITDNRIIHLEYDKVLETKSSQIMEWGNQTVLVPQSLSSNFTGKNVKVAVIDSGISEHEDLTIENGVSMVDYTDSYADDNGHGTYVAGIIGAKNNNIGIVGVATDSKLYAVKVLDSNGEGYLSDVMAGVDWAIQNEMDIINLSLGGGKSSPLLESMINKAVNQNILVVAAAGNDGTATGGENNVSYPARYEYVIAVGAINQNRQRATFSSTGEAVELAAPGENILSTDNNGSYNRVKGTSFATPFVSGVAALMKEIEPNLTAAQLRNKLQKESTDLGTAGRDPWYGFGLVQAPYYFRDIYGHWARESILTAYEKRWMVGSYQNFYPSRPLTRAEGAAIFVRVLELKSERKTNSFIDVPQKHWAVQNINTAADNGIMVGTSRDRFSPGAYLTREQMVVVLYRVLGKPEVDELRNPFTDVTLTDWSYKSIVTLKELGIVAEASTFGPKRPISRGEMAAFLKRISPYLGE